MRLAPSLERPLEAKSTSSSPTFEDFTHLTFDMDRMPLFKRLSHACFNVFWEFLYYFIDETWRMSRSLLDLGVFRHFLLYFILGGILSNSCK